MPFPLPPPVYLYLVCTTHSSCFRDEGSGPPLPKRESNKGPDAALHTLFSFFVPCVSPSLTSTHSLHAQHPQTPRNNQKQTDFSFFPLISLFHFLSLFFIFLPPSRVRVRRRYPKKGNPPPALQSVCSPPLPRAANKTEGKWTVPLASPSVPISIIFSGFSPICFQYGATFTRKSSFYGSRKRFKGQIISSGASVCYHISVVLSYWLPLILSTAREKGRSESLLVFGRHNPQAASAHPPRSPSPCTLFFSFSLFAVSHIFQNGFLFHYSGFSLEFFFYLAPSFDL